MLKLDLDGARSFLSEEEYRRAEEKALRSHRDLVEGNGRGSEWLGWRRILADPNDAELEEIDTLSSRIRERADLFIVCGIGGSYLGGRALVEALGPQWSSEGEPGIVYAGHHLGGDQLGRLMAWLQRPLPDGSPKSVYLNVISKSGTTLETALAFRILREWMRETYPDSFSERVICTTGGEGGALNRLSEQYGFRRLGIPDDVGGRFSVLTPVGLLPASVAGIDIRTLFYQAVTRFQALEDDPAPALAYAATRYALHERETAVDLLAVFNDRMAGMGRWLQQLLGESEGKEGKGLFPVVSSYTTDLHSLGQIVQQGRRNLMETFIRVEEHSESPVVPREETNHDGLNYLAGRSLGEINRRAYEGTRRAHRQGGVPSITVSLDRLNEQHLGDFIYFYELVTAIYGYCLDINPFDQPGVEDYKSAMYHLLGK